MPYDFLQGYRGPSDLPLLNPDGSYRMMPFGQPSGTGLLAPMDASGFGGGGQPAGTGLLAPMDASALGGGVGGVRGPGPSPLNAGEDRNFFGVPHNPFSGPALGPRADNFSQGRNFFGVPFNEIDTSSSSLDNLTRFGATTGVGLGAGGAVAAGIGAGSRALGGGQGNSGGSMNLLPGGGGSAEQGQGGLFDSLLGGLGNLSPAILAGYLGNRQRQDVMGQVGRLNTLGDSLSGPAFMNSITNPYDLQTGQGRTALTQNLQQRGVGGSSFGNQQLGNYDYMRGLGRGDLATRAQAGIAGTQGQLYSDALRGMVGGNAAYNQLLGGGLGASGSLFNRPGGIGSTGNGLFDWLRNLGGGGGSPGVPGVTGDPNIDPNTGLPANYPGADGSVIDPNTGFPGMGGSPFDPGIDWGSLYG